MTLVACLLSLNGKFLTVQVLILLILSLNYSSPWNISSFSHFFVYVSDQIMEGFYCIRFNLFTFRRKLFIGQCLTKHIAFLINMSKVSVRIPSWSQRETASSITHRTALMYHLKSFVCIEYRPWTLPP